MSKEAYDWKIKEYRDYVKTEFSWQEQNPDAAIEELGASKAFWDGLGSYLSEEIGGDQARWKRLMGTLEWMTVLAEEALNHRRGISEQ